MGTTIIVAIVFWLASSFIEYKIVKSYPSMRGWFHGLQGIVISLTIGFLLSVAVGASNAMPIVLAQIAGLATNEQMFGFFDWCGRKNKQRIIIQEVISTKVNTLTAQVEKVKEIEARHPTLVGDVKQTTKDGAKLIGAVSGATVVSALYIAGTPAKAVRGTRRLVGLTTKGVKGATAITTKGVKKGKATVTSTVNVVRKSTSTND